jgi:hypothetical protein
LTLRKPSVAFQSRLRDIGKLPVAQLGSTSRLAAGPAVAIDHSGHAIDEGLTLSVGLERALVPPKQKNGPPVTLSEKVLADVPAAFVFEFNTAKPLH